MVPVRVLLLTLFFISQSESQISSLETVAVESDEEKMVAITELAITTFNDYKEMFPTCVKNAACWGAAVLRRGGNYRTFVEDLKTETAEVQDIAFITYVGLSRCGGFSVDYQSGVDYCNCEYLCDKKKPKESIYRKTKSDVFVVYRDSQSNDAKYCTGPSQINGGELAHNNCQDRNDPSKEQSEITRINRGSDSVGSASDYAVCRGVAVMRSSPGNVVEFAVFAKKHTRRSEEIWNESFRKIPCDGHSIDTASGSAYCLCQYHCSDIIVRKRQRIYHKSGDDARVEYQNVLDGSKKYCTTTSAIDEEDTKFKCRDHP